MPDAETTLLSLRRKVAAFVRERDWEQFHNAKDLAVAIAIEAAELMAPMLWKSPVEVDALVNDAFSRQQLEDELADVLILCLSLANRLEIDVAEAVSRKMMANAAKYPTRLARGKAEKYTSYLGHGDETSNR